MITTLNVEAVSTGKSGTTKKGTPWHQVSIKADGKWFGGMAFSDEELAKIQNLKKDDKVVVSVYQEEYNGKMYDKFKFPSDKEQLQEEINKIKDVINNLVKLNNLRVK